MTQREPFLLSALIAPGSIESEVGGAQANLFSEHGLASALALPPLIPIAFLDAARVERSLLREMDRSVARGWRMRLVGAGWIGGSVLWPGAGRGETCFLRPRDSTSDAVRSPTRRGP